MQILAVMVISILFFVSTHSYFGLLKAINPPPYAGRSALTSSSFMNKHCVSFSPCKAVNESVDAETIMLIGDSHAEMFSLSMARLSRANKLNLEIWTSPGCRFTVHSAGDEFSSRDCISRNLELLDYIRLHQPDKIVLSQAVYRENNLSEMKAGLKKIYQLRVPIFIIGAIPNFPNDQKFMKIPSLISPKVKFSRIVSLDKMDKTNEKAIYEIEQYAKKLGLEVIDTKSFFCSVKNCERYKKGKWLYFDSSHLSIYGAQLLEPGLSRSIFKNNNVN
jgi:hypothetical protein